MSGNSRLSILPSENETHIAVRLLGAGFLDNSIMLLAGDAIESHFGAKLGISALACAALGNTQRPTTVSI